jgi:hypothetical protein
LTCDRRAVVNPVLEQVATASAIRLTLRGRITGEHIYSAQSAYPAQRVVFGGTHGTIESISPGS